MDPPATAPPLTPQSLLGPGQQRPMGALGVDAMFALNPPPLKGIPYEHITSLAALRGICGNNPPPNLGLFNQQPMQACKVCLATNLHCFSTQCAF